jgi:hypothetical protein
MIFILSFEPGVCRPLRFGAMQISAGIPREEQTSISWAVAVE